MSKCIILVQISKVESFTESVRDIRLFVVYRRYMDLRKACFRHYFAAIGYAGGRVQEECSYRIDGSSPAQQDIYLTSLSCPLEWEQKLSKENNIAVTTLFDPIDKAIQNEIQSSIFTYLRFNEDLNCFVWNSRYVNLDDSGYYADDLFPLKHLKDLMVTHWPFSLSFT